MELKNAFTLENIEAQSFIQKLDLCKGNVFLVTGEGDHLNLRSKLCQLVGLSSLIEGGRISEAFIVCEDKEDKIWLLDEK